MSLYNMVHGTNPLAGLILAVLGVKPAEVPRFRDAYYNGSNLVILTRTGGGNREAYEEQNQKLTELHGYLTDADTAFDSTFAEFHYSVPDQFLYLLEYLNKYSQTKDLGTRWEEELEKIKNAGTDDPRVQRMVDVLAPVFRELSEK